MRRRRHHRTVAFYVRGVEETLARDLIAPAIASGAIVAWGSDTSFVWFSGKAVTELRATRDRLIAAGGTSVRSPAVDDVIVDDKAPPVLRRLAHEVTSTFGDRFGPGEKVWTVPCFGGRAPLFYNLVRVQRAEERMIQVSTVIGDLPAPDEPVGVVGMGTGMRPKRPDYSVN